MAWIVEGPHHMGERVDLAQVADVGGFFQRLLPDGADVDVLDGGVSEFLRIVERGQAIEAVVGNLGDADVGLARVRESVLGEVRLGQNVEQRCLAYLGQADDAGFHKIASGYRFRAER